jgi:hypothetical protein
VPINEKECNISVHTELCCVGTVLLHFFFHFCVFQHKGDALSKKSDGLLRLHLLPHSTYRTEEIIAAKPYVSLLRHLSRPYTTCLIRAKKESELSTGTFQRTSTPFSARDLRSGVHSLLPQGPGTEEERSLNSGIPSVTSQHTARNVCQFPIQAALCT